ncbi:MAG TPA: DUF6659 family protein [Candidatus Bathyarchaeia archaeon]|nr:DUF6659 family protein [Candidatus Bathyarchaeia archaeon]
MDYNKLCKDILGLDTKIRFAGVCDDTGEIRFGGPREGIKSMLTTEQTKISNLQALIRWELRNSLSHKIGREKYSMEEYDKIKRIIFTLDHDHLLLVTTEVDTEHMKVIYSILKQLGKGATLQVV